MGAVSKSLSDVRLNLVENLDDAMEFMRWLGERRPILACDTETGGLEWWKQPLRLVQVGDGQTGWAIPWQDWGGLAKQALREYEGEIVFHNLKFDLHFLEMNGAPMRRDRLHDTSIMSHLLDPLRPRALKKLAQRFVDPFAAAGQSSLTEGMHKNKWTWATVPVDFGPYWVYSALDPVITARIHEQFYPQITSEFWTVYETELAVLFAVADMERRGMAVDLAYCRDAHDRLYDYVDETKQWIKAEFGVPAGSLQQVAHRLRRDGVELTEKTKSGGWKMDEGVLSSLDHPLAGAVLDVRQTQKIAKSYFAAIIRNEHNGKIHCDVNPLGARTGRMSVSRPPLQQLPSGSPLVRDAFVSEHGRLISTDWDQVELRLLAHFADERKMIEAIHAGVDLHTWAAQQIHRREEISKPERKLVKNGSFLKVYGGGAGALAEQQGIPEAEAEEFLAMYDATFPGVPRFGEKLEREARRRLQTEEIAYIKTPIGRRHRIEEEFDPETGKRQIPYYKLTNYMIQGTAADLLKRKVIALDDAGAGEYLRLLVHDEVIADAPTGEAEEIARLISDVMTETEEYVVPLTASAEIVSRWGDAYDYCTQGSPERCSRPFCTERKAA